MPPPCRLFVIPARDAPVAAVIRRGPSDWYQLVRWDLARDELTDGAWFKGRIYEERCDLSPDGELFLYFVHGGRQRAGYTDSWTAVSRLPWLFALALWPSGTTYGGGGRFTANRAVVIRHGSPQPHPDHLPDGLEVVAGAPEHHASDGAIEGAEWSGRDHLGRVIFAREGKLYRRRGDDEDVEVADLNDRKPAPVPAPAWARRAIGVERAPRGRAHRR